MSLTAAYGGAKWSPRTDSMREDMPLWWGDWGSSSEWQALWKAHGRGVIPAVDFTQSMVVGVFAGSRPTAGFRITIESVVSDGPAIRVEYREERPSPDDLVAQMLTAPFHLVVIPRRDGAVEFQSR